MKILKTIIAVTILSFFSISCSNDDKSTPDSTKPTYLLTKTIYIDGYSNYTYDANNKLSIVEQVNPGSSNYKTTFFYNSNGRLEETLDSSSGGPFPSSIITRITYIYDVQNRLIERKFFENSNDYPAVYDYKKSEFFEYNANSVTQKTLQKGNSLPSSRLVFDFNSNGNV
ncbi:MAG: hypothetical protein ABI793_17570, partial [Flavobacterium sp.]